MCTVQIYFILNLAVTKVLILDIGFKSVVLRVADWLILGRAKGVLGIPYVQNSGCSVYILPAEFFSCFYFAFSFPGLIPFLSFQTQLLVNGTATIMLSFLWPASSSHLGFVINKLERSRTSFLRIAPHFSNTQWKSDMWTRKMINTFWLFLFFIILYRAASMEWGGENRPWQNNYPDVHERGSSLTAM